MALKIGFSKRNTYYPTDILRGDKGKSDVTAVNVVNIEDYIRGLVPLEMNHAWNMSALKAQAVCVRSFGAAVSGFGSDSDIKKDIS